jgi:phosphoribosylformimino-5-aminoimidazole carboxamide ribotide isomerase
MAEAIQIPVQLGGGLRNLDDVASALSAGIERVVLGTAAIGPDLKQAAMFRRDCLGQFGDRILIGLDARSGMLAIRGWLETTSLNAFQFARTVRDEGFQQLVYTDISRDGALTGPNFEHLRRLIAIPELSVIASGGIGQLEDLLALDEAGAEAAIVGQALYSGAIELTSAIRTLAKRGLDAGSS